MLEMFLGVSREQQRTTTKQSTLYSIWTSMLASSVHLAIGLSYEHCQYPYIQEEHFQYTSTVHRDQ